MKIAVEGCAHGELDKIYEAIHHLESKEGIKLDLLICCGDFQATRNVQDLKCMAVPQKYQNMCSFYKYYSGGKTAPVLTLFIGGNHEASNYLQELAYGGWVAPRIYYMGYASIVSIAGVRIAGLSGIYKGHDYLKGHFEKPPYSEDTKRSVYHIRNLEIFRLKQVQQPVDIFLSHDWPRGIYKHGDVQQLLKYKPFFSKEIESNTLGSKPCEELLQYMKPKYWFAAHLHVKFAAIVEHPSDNENNKQTTKFLALDKCLPRRRFLQVVEIPHDTSKPLELEYDLEWLTVLHLTNHLLSIKKTMQYMPGPGLDGRWDFTPTKEELEVVRQKFNGDLRVPENFTQTVTPFEPGTLSDSSESTPSKHHRNRYGFTQQPAAQLNPQTMFFCERLGISDPMALLINYNSNDSSLDSSQVSSCDTLPSYLTPERSANITQVSLDESSELTLEESIELELSAKPMSRTGNSSLLLPSPLNSDLDEGGRESSPENEVRRRISLSPKDSDDAEEKSFLGNDGSQQSSSSGVVSTNELPTDSETAGEPIAGPEPRVKKFKRRNQSLYSSAEEDG